MGNIDDLSATSGGCRNGGLMPLENLQPVSIEFLADRFPRREIIFVTDTEKYKQNTQTVPGILIDRFEQIKGDFWYILKWPDESVVKAYPRNRIPTIESVLNLYGKGTYKSYICQPGKDAIVTFFTI